MRGLRTYKLNNFLCYLNIRGESVHLTAFEFSMQNAFAEARAPDCLWWPLSLFPSGTRMIFNLTCQEARGEWLEEFASRCSLRIDLA